jgi:methionyl-tRNA formyltransferase
MGPPGAPARVAFFGTPRPAVPALRALLAADDLDVVVAVTNPDRPAGRGKTLQPPPVKVAAQEAGVTVWQPERPRDALDELRGLDLDAAAVVAYGSILPTEVLDTGGTGFVNLHFSLLPAWRGAAPVTHTLLAGDTQTGVTCFRLDEGMDTGPVLARTRTPVVPDETAGTLTERLARLGAPLLLVAVRDLAAGRARPVAQNHDDATFAPKVTTHQALLDWARPAAELARAVRAFNPAPGAHTTFAGGRLKVHRAAAIPLPARRGVGVVIGVDHGAPLVACGEGALRLDEVQLAGKKAMTGEAFAHGHAPVGHRLGT